MMPPKMSRKMLRDDVHDILLYKLLTGEFAPGKSLGIDSTARLLGVSPTPVREALVELEHTGLVTRTALKGYRVAPPVSAAHMAELMDARMVIELGTVERAARDLDALLPKLREAHVSHGDVIRKYSLQLKPSTADPEQIVEYFDADWRFHQTIIDSAANRFLRQFASGLGSNVHRMRQSLGVGLSDAVQAHSEHAKILSAFETGSAKDAMAAMRKHLELVASRAEADSRVERRVEALLD